MGGKYSTPIAAMLGGLAAWMAFVEWIAVGGGIGERPHWLAPIVCLVAGGSIVVSGFS